MYIIATFYQTLASFYIYNNKVMWHKTTVIPYFNGQNRKPNDLEEGICIPKSIGPNKKMSNGTIVGC